MTRILAVALILALSGCGAVIESAGRSQQCTAHPDYVGCGR